MERMTAVEKNLLVELVIKNRDVLENKRTDAVTLADKVRCWRNVEAEFNGNSQVVKVGNTRVIARCAH